MPNRSTVTLSDDLLATVTTPTLLWWGADDTFGGEAVARHVAGALPDAELVMVPDTGHLSWLDDPRGAAAATITFLGAEVGSR